MRAQHKIFFLRDYDYHQEFMLEDVNKFLTDLGPNKLINVSMSYEKQVIV